MAIRARFLFSSGVHLGCSTSIPPGEDAHSLCERSVDCRDGRLPSAAEKRRLAASLVSSMSFRVRVDFSKDPVDSLIGLAMASPGEGDEHSFRVVVGKDGSDPPCGREATTGRPRCGVDKKFRRFRCEDGLLAKGEPGRGTEGGEPDGMGDLGDAGRLPLCELR